MASRFWIKDPQDRKYVSWHQDHAYFGLKPPTIITAWIALNEVTRHNGCMRVIPGSHQSGTHKHIETNDKDNLLSRGQAIADVDETQMRSTACSSRAKCHCTTAMCFTARNQTRRTTAASDSP